MRYYITLHFCESCLLLYKSIKSIPCGTINLDTENIYCIHIVNDKINISDSEEEEDSK